MGLFGDEVMCAALPGDSWRWRHDNLKVTLMSIANESMIQTDAEVFGLFRDLIPAELTRQGGDLQYGRQQVGLTPGLLLQLPTPDGVRVALGEIKCMSAGASRYPPGKTEKQADRQAKELPGLYSRVQHIKKK